eukprot:352598-Chlamydomonas_euryale.AAC.19
MARACIEAAQLPAMRLGKPVGMGAAATSGMGSQRRLFPPTDHWPDEASGPWIDRLRDSSCARATQLLVCMTEPQMHVILGQDWSKGGCHTLSFQAGDPHYTNVVYMSCLD